MRELYDSIQKQKINEGDDTFVAKVNLSLHKENDGRPEIIDLEYSNKIEMTYIVEIEYRSYGIKGIMVSPSGVLNIEYQEVWYDDKDDQQSEEKTLEINWSDVQFNQAIYREEWHRGDGYWIEGIEVELDKDGKLKAVIVNIVYALPHGA